MYNLTDKQCDVLRQLVQQVRAENISEEFSVLYMLSGEIHYSSSSGPIKNASALPLLSKGTIDALEQSGLLIVRRSDKGRWYCTLLRNAYKAVDSNFDETGDIMNTSAPHTLFGTPDAKYARDLFVLMPIATNLDPIYFDHIKKVAENLKLSIARADDFRAPNVITKDIWSAIVHASIIVADCTGKNPNVFYEIGIAHTIGKHVILITQASEDVPFDINHIRYIRYTYTPPGRDKFETNLSETILEVKKTLEETSPVKIDKSPSAEEWIDALKKGH